MRIVLWCIQNFQICPPFSQLENVLWKPIYLMISDRNVMLRLHYSVQPFPVIWTFSVEVVWSFNSHFKINFVVKSA